MSKPLPKPPEIAGSLNTLGWLLGLTALGSIALIAISFTGSRGAEMRALLELGSLAILPLSLAGLAAMFWFASTVVKLLHQIDQRLKLLTDYNGV